MNRSSLLLFATLCPAVASAGDLSVGFGLGAAKDLPDIQTFGKFSVGPSLQIPFRMGLGDRASFRATIIADGASGNDRVTWGIPVPSTAPNTPASVRYASDAHFTYMVAAGLTVGLEASAKPSGWTPFIGVDAGPELANTYHSFGTDNDNTQILLTGLTDDELKNGNTLDPYTSQIAWLTDLRVGVHGPLSNGLDLWVETGYSNAFLGAKALTKPPDAISARREPYGYNAVRLAVGLSFAL